MKVRDLSPDGLRDRLADGALVLPIGSFRIAITTRLPDVAEAIGCLYADYPLLPSGEFVDFPVAVAAPGGVRRWLRPQVQFLFDGLAPFRPLPRAQAYPALEWGLNWCLAQHTARYLVLHAAVIERDGQAVILPGPPGSGKSTLCAGLVERGWRLLSDELTLLRMDDGRIDPVPRPVSLKNESIEVVRRFSPEAVIGPACADTLKGTVAHLKPRREAIDRMAEPAEAAHVVVPVYAAGQPARFRPRSRAHTLLHLIDNAFNFNLHGVAGFERACALIDAVSCQEFHYGRLEDALVAFDRLCQGEAEARAS